MPKVPWRVVAEWGLEAQSFPVTTAPSFLAGSAQPLALQGGGWGWGCAVFHLMLDTRAPALWAPARPAFLPLCSHVYRLLGITPRLM